MNRRWGPWAACLPVACYLALTVPLMGFPGLNIDEAGDGLAALSIGSRPGEPTPCVWGRVTVGGRVFPLTEGVYHGGFTPYLVRPAIGLLGPGTLALRATSVAVGALVLLLLFLACRAWFGQEAALAVALLTATDPVWAQYSRVLLHREEILLQLPWWAFWWALTSYARERAAWRFGLAGLALGLGLSMKITFLWYLAGLGALLATPSLRETLTSARPTRRAWALCAGACLAGLGFILAFNILESGITLRHLWGALFDQARTHGLESEVSNLAYGRNLLLRLAQLLDLLAGRLPHGEDWGITEPPAVLAAARLTVYLGALAGAVALASRGRLREGSRAFLALGLVYLTVALLTPFTLSGFDRGHLMSLFPFQQIAAGTLFAASSAGRRRVAAVAALAALLALNVGQYAADAREMRRTGGRARWSSAIDELARDLDARGARRPVTFGIGIDESLLYLTQGRVAPLMLPGAGTDAAPPLTEADFAPAVIDGRVTYVWGDALYERRAVRDAFLALLHANGARVGLERLILDRAGRPAYRVYSARLGRGLTRVPPGH